MVEFALKVTIVIFITEIIIAPVNIFTEAAASVASTVATALGVGSLGKKFAIKIINDFLNIKGNMCDASTQSLSRYCTYPVPVCRQR